jgi:hypothetical protein
MLNLDGILMPFWSRHRQILMKGRLRKKLTHVVAPSLEVCLMAFSAPSNEFFLGLSIQKTGFVVVRAQRITPGSEVK